MCLITSMHVPQWLREHGARGQVAHHTFSHLAKLAVMSLVPKVSLYKNEHDRAYIMQRPCYREGRSRLIALVYA